MFSDHTLPCICVCSNICIKIPHKNCRFSTWYSEKRIIYFIHKSLIFTLNIGDILATGTKWLIQYLNVQHADPWSQRNPIKHTVSQPGSCETPHTRFSRPTMISTRIEKFSSPMQIKSSRATSTGWRNFYNIKMISLCFLNHSSSFLERIFQLPNSSWWWFTCE